MFLIHQLFNRSPEAELSAFSYKRSKIQVASDKFPDGNQCFPLAEADSTGGEVRSFSNVSLENDTEAINIRGGIDGTDT